MASEAHDALGPTTRRPSQLKLGDKATPSRPEENIDAQSYGLPIFTFAARFVASRARAYFRGLSLRSWVVSEGR